MRRDRCENTSESAASLPAARGFPRRASLPTDWCKKQRAQCRRGAASHRRQAACCHTIRYRITRKKQRHAGFDSAIKVKPRVRTVAQLTRTVHDPEHASGLSLVESPRRARPTRVVDQATAQRASRICWSPSARTSQTRASARRRGAWRRPTPSCSVQSRSSRRRPSDAGYDELVVAPLNPVSLGLRAPPAPGLRSRSYRLRARRPHRWIDKPRARRRLVRPRSPTPGATNQTDRELVAREPQSQASWRRPRSRALLHGAPRRGKDRVAHRHFGATRLFREDHWTRQKLLQLAR